MIENWKNAHKMHSVQLSALVAVIAGLESFLPQLEGKIPAWAFAVASILVIVARLKSQPGLRTPEELWEAAQKAKDAAKKGGLILLVLICLSCSGRRACRADADAAFNDAVESCKIKDYDACPQIRTAEKRQDEDYERCP